MIAKLLPNQTSSSLDTLNTNSNLLTNSFCRLLKLTDFLSNRLNITSVIAEDNESEYDIVIARYLGDKLDSLDKSKPIYEFHYDSLNGGWFFERYTHNDIQYIASEQSEENSSVFITVNRDELRELLGDTFFRLETIQSVGEEQL